MTVTTTSNFGFIGVYNAVPSTNDWACTYWNWIALDEILYAAAVSHKHDGATALQNPTGTLSLSTATTGGYMPASTTYYIAITYIDAYLRETKASSVASITTGAGISTPATPTINDDATPTDIQTHPAGLTGGNYWYKISYVKDGGESLPSSPVYVSIPTDTTYECTIHFQSLNEVANGADAIYVYRKIGSTGSYVKLAEITAGSTNSYTDDNTGVPTCDKGPVTSSTISSFHTVTIDWSSLDFANAEKVRIYATTVSGTYPTNALVAEVTMNDATPVTSYVWTGTAGTAGKPPEISHCYANPSKIALATEVSGNLPWANLPSDFTWKQPVATSASLPAGIDGEVRMVEDENTLYTWDGDLATPTWVKVSAGITKVILPADFDYYMDSNEAAIFTYFPDNPENGDIVAVISQNTGMWGQYVKVVYLYMWREDWATPTWQLITPILPSKRIDDDAYMNWSAPAGTMWTEETEAGLYTIKVMLGHPYHYAVSWDRITSTSVGDSTGYYGEFDTLADVLDSFPEGPGYDYGSVVFVWDEKCFYYYDSDIATPAWVRGIGVVKQDTTIDDVVEDATPTPEQLKINEILTVLRTSGLIAT
jgi:hypothetical protein